MAHWVIRWTLEIMLFVRVPPEDTRRAERKKKYLSSLLLIANTYEFLPLHCTQHFFCWETLHTHVHSCFKNVIVCKLFKLEGWNRVWDANTHRFWPYLWYPKYRKKYKILIYYFIQCLTFEMITTGLNTYIYQYEQQHVLLHSKKYGH